MDWENARGAGPQLGTAVVGAVIELNGSHERNKGTAADSPVLDVEHLRGWIGREEVAEDVVSVDLVRRFHATLDLPGEAPRDGDIAPPLVHFCLARPSVPTSLLDEDGLPKRGDFLPPVPLPRRMWAGGDISFHDALRVGEQVRRVSRVQDVTFKQGRSGFLCFVRVEHRLDVDHREILTERQDIVFLEAEASRPAGAALTRADIGEHSRTFDASPTSLFRYSALTFNAHRIHYDRRYAQDIEGYPGLVVHGPLQATLLINMAMDIHGRPPDHFAFRSQSPLFDDDPVILQAVSEGRSLKLWSARPDGPVAMTARSEWK